MLSTASGTEKVEAPGSATARTQEPFVAALYVPSLDGLRFFAFLAVFVHHSAVAGVPGLGYLNRIGWFGVELFFVISAYLFLHLLRAEQAKTGTINKQQFFARRIFRLYPAMITYAAMMLLIAHDVSGLWDFLSIATFTKNIEAAVYGYASGLPFIAHLWTLAFEFQVYLAIPALFLVWHRYGTRGLVTAVALIWVVAVALRSAAILANLQHPTIWVLPLTRPDSVIAGLLLATVTIQPNPRLAIPVIVVCAIVIGVPPRPGTGPYDMILYPVVALMCFLITWLAVMWRPAVDFLGSGSLRYLGRISYGLYLYHFAAIAAAHRVVQQFLEQGALASALSVVISFAVSIAVAAASYQWLELPFLRMKNRVAAVQSVPT